MTHLVGLYPLEQTDEEKEVLKGRPPVVFFRTEVNDKSLIPEKFAAQGPYSKGLFNAIQFTKDDERHQLGQVYFDYYPEDTYDVVDEEYFLIKDK